MINWPDYHACRGGVLFDRDVYQRGASNTNLTSPRGRLLDKRGLFDRASIRKFTVSRYLLFATENEELINVNFKSQTTMNLSYFSNLKTSISARVKFWFPVRKVLFCPGGS